MSPPDWEAFERNRSYWRFEGRKERFMRALRIYGLATITIFAAGLFFLWEIGGW